MDSISTEENVHEKVMVDFHYFIQSAVQKNISWNSLAIFLTDLTPTLDQSRQVIKILVQELEKWVSKIENETKEDDCNIFPESIVQDSISQDQASEHAIENTESSVPDEDDYSEDVKLFPDETDKNSEEFEENFENHFQESENESIHNSTFIVEESSNAIRIDLFNKPSKSGNSKNNISSEIKEYKCSICSKDFDSNYMLLRHDRIHEEQKLYHCNTCDISFSQKSHLKGHEKIHYSKRPFQCKICEKCFNIPNMLKHHHESVQKGDISFQCKLCNESLERTSEIINHQSSHNTDRPCKCKTCNRSFVRIHHLKSHEKTHTGEKPFQCETCNKFFTRSTNLKAHKRLHIAG